MEGKMEIAGRVKTVSLYFLIGFLVLTGVFAIFEVIAGEFGQNELKVLATMLVIVLASMGILCCSMYSEKSGHVVPGLSGTVLVIAAAFLLILGIWAGLRADTYWKTTAIAGIFAVACAHALALLSVRLSTKYLWIRVTATVNIFLLAAVLSSFIISETMEESAFRLMIVLSILAALQTLIIPILKKVTETDEHARSDKNLSLTRRADGLWEDIYGDVYSVERKQHSESDIKG